MTLRLAVVGVGRMGALHAVTLSATPGIEVVAVVDSRPEVAAVVAAQASTMVMTSLDQLAARDDVEAWLIATPTPTHPEVVRAGLAAGVHLLCEKPLALDPAVGEALANQAATADRILQVGFWRRFSPPWRRAQELVVQGAIGRPLSLRLAQWDAHPPPPAFCDPAVSGGLAIDCGVHEYDLAEWLTGERVERVSARHLPVVSEPVGRSGDVDNLVALLDLSGGGSAVVDLSRNARYGDDVRTEVLGSEGALFVDLLPTGRTRLATSAGVSVVEGSEVEDGTRAGIAAQALALAAAVRGEPKELPGATASNRAVMIGRAVQRSATEGRPIDL